jgi:K+-sensing histidine kinase KdpD
MVKIIDQGTGIDPKELPYIFDPFHRGKGIESSEGYGVGLVKDFYEARGFAKFRHGGRILES